MMYETWAEYRARRFRGYGTKQMPHCVTADDFEARVIRGEPDECWPWTGPYTSEGHGTVSLALEHRHDGAHRVAWAIANGVAVPSGMCVLHRCDNARCCNPAHLYLGTRADNARDSRERHRLERAAGLPPRYPNDPWAPRVRRPS